MTLRPKAPAIAPHAIEQLHPRAWHGGVLLFVCVLSLIAVRAQGAAGTQNIGPYETLLAWTPFIMKGFLLNLLISFLAMTLGTVAGVFLGLWEISSLAPLRITSSLFTQVCRNTPWIVTLFCVMLLVPFKLRLGAGVVLILPDWLKATVGFSFPIMANVSEIVRGAVLSIPPGQWKSAESLAFSRRQTLWLIILPQCAKRMIPPWMNWYAILALSTPIASILGVHEAVGNAQAAMEAAGAQPAFLIPFYSFILALFFAYIYPISRLTIWLERKFSVAS